MKEVFLALMLGIAICYEIITFIKARSYVRTFYMRSRHELDENDKTVKFGIGCFSIFYIVFLFLGMALSNLWFIYLTIFLMSIIQSPINRYLRKRKYWETLIQVKRFDSLVSIAILTFLFFAHFHPEVINIIW
jgi:hypothetical protein